jgi:predicted negative regulator of RcsB-dependent stress response
MNSINEGEKLNKLKNHLKKNWKSYALGAAAVGALGGKCYLKNRSIEAASNSLNQGIVSQDRKNKAEQFGKIVKEIEKVRKGDQ